MCDLKKNHNGVQFEVGRIVRQTSITERYVTKTDDPALMRIEIEKHRQACDIGRQSGLFYVPRIIDYDISSGVAKFERLHGLKGLKRMLAYTRSCGSLIRRLAMSLALIHKELSLPRDMTIPIAPEIELPGKSEVFLHGDYSLWNIFLAQGNETPVILDWQMTPHFGRSGSYGTRYFDLMWFVYSLFNRPSHRFPLSLSATPYGRLFIETYFGSSDYTYNSGECYEYMIKLFEMRLNRKKASLPWQGKMMRILPGMRLMRFAHSFKPQRLPCKSLYRP